MKPPRKKKPLTLTAYAEHRGVSQPTVTRAVQTGRLKESVARGANGDPVIVAWVLVGGDLEHARGWEGCPWAEGLGLVPEGRPPAEFLQDLLAGVGVEF